MREKRSEHRRTVHKDISYLRKWIESGRVRKSPEQGTVLDTSLCGFGIESPHAVRTGDVLMIDPFGHGGMPFRFNVKWVAQVEERFRFGCRFVHIS